MDASQLVRETYVRLLAGYRADALIRTAILAEALLKHVLGKPADAKGMLGELIGEASRARRDLLGEELLGELNRLNKLRIEAAHFTGREASIDDVQRLAETVVEGAIRFGMLDETSAEAARRAADWQASEPASTALLRLDRAEQRRGLDDLLAQSRRVLVLLVHGEVGQGHDHFGEVANWRTKAVPKGQWRQVQVEWPVPSSGLATRLGFLLESFAVAVGVPFDPPAVEPSGESGEAAWRAALERVFAGLGRIRERIYLRHVIGWLDRGDVELVGRYLRMVWAPLAERSGERLLCCLELRRAEVCGLPLSRAWRISRHEQRIAGELATRIEEEVMPRSGHCAALPELVSVSPTDLADWLRNERQLARSAALEEANQLVTMTRGGRFDLVVQRLATMNLDTRKPR